MNSFCVSAKLCTDVLHASPPLCIATGLGAGCSFTHFADDQTENHRGEAVLQTKIEDVNCEPRST